MLNKEDIYVIVDTPKKEKKLTKILEKFGETISTRPDHKNISHNGEMLGWAYGYSNSSWQEVYTRPPVLNGKSLTEVSVKQLKTILKAERTKHEVEDILVELESQKHEVPNIEFELTPDDPFAELKEAHKNGLVIQIKSINRGYWTDVKNPIWTSGREYRIKPEEEFKLNRTTFCSKETKILINHFRPDSVEIGCYFREQKAFHTFTDKQQLVQFIGVLKNIADKM